MTEPAKIDPVVEVMRTVKATTLTDTTGQGKIVAANLILEYGSEAFTARGFVACLTQAFEMSLLWHIERGVVELTEGHTSSDEERAERLAHVEAARSPEGTKPSPRQAGGYV